MQEDHANEKFLGVNISGFVKEKGHDESTIEDVKVQDDPTIEMVYTLL